MYNKKFDDSKSSDLEINFMETITTILLTVNRCPLNPSSHTINPIHNMKMCRPSGKSYTLKVCNPPGGEEIFLGMQGS